MEPTATWHDGCWGADTCQAQETDINHCREGEMTKKERSEIEMNKRKETASLLIHNHMTRVRK